MRTLGEPCGTKLWNLGNLAGTLQEPCRILGNLVVTWREPWNLVGTLEEPCGAKLWNELWAPCGPCGAKLEPYLARKVWEPCRNLEAKWAKLWEASGNLAAKLWEPCANLGAKPWEPWGNLGAKLWEPWALCWKLVKQNCGNLGGTLQGNLRGCRATKLWEPWSNLVGTLGTLGQSCGNLVGTLEQSCGKLEATLEQSCGNLWSLV